MTETTDPIDPYLTQQMAALGVRGTFFVASGWIPPTDLKLAEWQHAGWVFADLWGKTTDPAKLPPNVPRPNGDLRWIWGAWFNAGERFERRPKQRWQLATRSRPTRH